MRSVAIVSLLLSALLSSGCLVGSLQPFYEADTLEFDEALLGEWENRDEGTVIQVDRGSGNRIK